MSKLNMIGNIKEVFPETVILIKVGTFYEAYNKDAEILSYLFNYKLREIGISDINCGFPSAALNKVITKLEDEKINYSVVDKSHNYEEIEKMNFKNKNKYNDISKIASERIDKEKRAKDIYLHLLSDDINKIEEVEKLLYE